MATYSIRDLENISGIKAHTLRIWEQRYDILKPKRTDTNIRFYEEDDLRLLLSISMLNANGVKISAIAKMTNDDIHEACRNLNDVSEAHSNLLNSLILAMIDLDEEKFEKLIGTATAKYGFEETITDLVYPFFKRVGILWQTGTIKPVQEHFVSNLIRQKLIVAIDKQNAVTDPLAPTYALFLPENEYHELGLLFAAYILRARKNKVIYLGQNVPEEDLDSVYETYQPKYFLTILTIPPTKESVTAMLDRIGKKFPKSKMLVSGAAALDTGATTDNVIVLEKVSDLNRFANRS